MTQQKVAIVAGRPDGVEDVVGPHVELGQNLQPIPS